MEKREMFYTVGGNANESSQYRKEYGGFLKN